MAEKTDLYHMKEHGKTIAVRGKSLAQEIRQMVGISILMGSLNLSQIRLYWNKKYFLPIVARTLPTDRYHKLRNHLHFASEEDRNENDALGGVWALKGRKTYV
jgi:hypothetical protein